MPSHRRHHSTVESLEERRLLASSATVTVAGTVWGQSTQSIGAVEGSEGFNINDLKDLGVTNYRIYGGTSRWEAQDDDGVYGSPTIADIKANVASNPNIINWAAWDSAMTAPPGGTDYWWTGDNNRWQGSAAQMFQALKDAGIKPILTLRNRDDNGNPAWFPQSLQTEADKNEWWEHVFATVYWLNVRNNYNVNDFEILNEPNNASQGFTAKQSDYYTIATVTKDAIDFAYQTFLPGRKYHVYAPSTTGGSSWPRDVMQNVPGTFDTVDIHDYDADITSYVEKVHGWMNTNGFANAPLWLGEWGTFSNQYDSTSFDVSVISNLIRGSRPGIDHVDGSDVFSLYDWDAIGASTAGDFQGLISGSGAKRAGYYAMRMGIRALQGGKDTFQSASSNSNVLAITTEDDVAGVVDVLLTNKSTSALPTTVNLGALIAETPLNPQSAQWQFSSTALDTQVGGAPALVNGQASFTMPGTSAELLQFNITQLAVKPPPLRRPAFRPVPQRPGFAPRPGFTREFLSAASSAALLD